MRLGLIFCGVAVVLVLSGQGGPCADLGFIIGLLLAIIGWLMSVVGLGLALNQDLKLVIGSAAMAAAFIGTIVLLGNAWGAWNVFEIESWAHVAVFAWAPVTSSTVLVRRLRRTGI